MLKTQAHIRSFTTKSCADMDELKKVRISFRLIAVTVSHFGPYYIAFLFLNNKLTDIGFQWCYKFLMLALNCLQQASELTLGEGVERVLGLHLLMFTEVSS